MVQVETHDACRCGCEEVSCTDLQIYDKRMCKCRCRDQGAMGQCLVQYNKVRDRICMQESLDDLECFLFWVKHLMDFLIFNRSGILKDASVSADPKSGRNVTLDLAMMVFTPVSVCQDPPFLHQPLFLLLLES